MLITPQIAIDHLRADADDPRVQPMLDAAERFAVERLDRNVYEDAAELTAAVAAAPAALAAAKTAYDAAIEASQSLTDEDLREAAETYAESSWRLAQSASDRTQYGIVMNAEIKAAILLQLQHLFEGTDTVSAVEALLQPHRRLGV